jgi:hypothetical protein
MNGNNDLTQTLQVLEEIWAANSDDVARIGLHYVPGGVERIGTVVYVPLKLVTDDVSYWEMSRLIDRLQEQVENRIGTDVTLVMDPAA